MIYKQIYDLDKFNSSARTETDRKILNPDFESAWPKDHYEHIFKRIGYEETYSMVLS